MTVKELTKELSKYKPNTEVYMDILYFDDDDNELNMSSTIADVKYYEAYDAVYLKDY
mgnify:FL=1